MDIPNRPPLTNNHENIRSNRAYITGKMEKNEGSTKDKQVAVTQSS